MTPKEDPAVKAARERDRKLAEAEAERAGMASTATMTSDLQRAYGSRFSLFGPR